MKNQISKSAAARPTFRRSYVYKTRKKRTFDLTRAKMTLANHQKAVHGFLGSRNGNHHCQHRPALHDIKTMRLQEGLKETTNVTHCLTLVRPIPYEIVLNMLRQE